MNACASHRDGQARVRLGDIGYAIQQHAEKNNCSIVREFAARHRTRVP